MWFCVRCGKKLDKAELIRGYCLNCFVKHVDLFKDQPVFKLVKCPVCNSWNLRGEWLPPITVEEAVENIVSYEAPKHLINGSTLESVELREIKYLDNSTIEATIDFNILVDDKPVSIERNILVKVSYSKCPRCIARSVGKHTHLVQVRFTTRNPPRTLIQKILSIISSTIQGDSIVDIKELSEGLDIELDDPTATRKLIEALSKNFSSRIDTSFKPTRYDPSQGKWIGVTTYVARIPVFHEDDIVIYRDRVGIVRAIDQGKIWLELPETGEIREVDLSLYWKKELRHPVRVESETLVVRELRGDHVVLESVATGETRIIRAKERLKQLKPGDQVILLRADNIETIAPGYRKGD